MVAKSVPTKPLRAHQRFCRISPAKITRPLRGLLTNMTWAAPRRTQSSSWSRKNCSGGGEWRWAAGEGCTYSPQHRSYTGCQYVERFQQSCIVYFAALSKDYECLSFSVLSQSFLGRSWAWDGLDVFSAHGHCHWT